MVKFRLWMTLDVDVLRPVQIETLLAGLDGLLLMRARFVEVYADKLGCILARFRSIEQAVAAGGVACADAMRLVAGAALGGESAGAPDPDWSQVVAGPWLAETLQGLRTPEGLARVEPGAELKATLRPYQQAGVRRL